MWVKPEEYITHARRSRIASPAAAVPSFPPMSLVTAGLIGKRTGLYGWPSGSSIDSEDTLRFSAMTGARPMTEVFPLEHAEHAYARMMSNKARFRVVLTTGA